jgi:hypothetical protein
MLHGQRLSLRKIAVELAARGHLTAYGNRHAIARSTACYGNRHASGQVIT